MRLIIKEDVLPVIKSLQTVSDSVREQALTLTERLENDCDLINLACSEVLLDSNRSQEVYHRALRWAEEGKRLAPDQGHIVQNVPGALYRVGRYQQAAALAQEAYELNRKEGQIGRREYDLLFLAMSQRKLGQTDLARATLKRVPRQLILPHVWREAEALIEGKAP